MRRLSMPLSISRPLLLALALASAVAALLVGCVADEDDPGALATDCATTHCSETKDACLGDTACATLVDCATGCSTSACVSTCEADADTVTVEMFTAYWNCLAANQCFVMTAPPDNSACLAENCADEVAACEAAGCQDYLDCIAGCAGSEGVPACTNACAMDNSDGVDAYTAQFTCEQENCVDTE